jgi:hypothetical protein
MVFAIFGLTSTNYQQQQQDTEVNWEDQQNINSFGRLNNEMHDIEDDLKRKEVCFVHNSLGLHHSHE